MVSATSHNLRQVLDRCKLVSTTRKYLTNHHPIYFFSLTFLHPRPANLFCKGRYMGGGWHIFSALFRRRELQKRLVVAEAGNMDGGCVPWGAVFPSPRARLKQRCPRFQGHLSSFVLSLFLYGLPTDSAPHRRIQEKFAESPSSVL